MQDEVSKSWYTKYRPYTMNEYSGDRVKNIIKNRFTKRSNMPHVVMIQGERGCGKTTCARILSKYYLCENPHEDGTPCEECETCKAINEILIDGESTQVECPGVTEVDATTMNGKEAIQNILEGAVQAPIYTQYKVLIIDEVHMVTAAAQNSMLKIIEDIPQHLVVIFATTNPEKVLQTIKSRCQLTIEVRRQSVEDMVNRLLEISAKEGLSVSKKALEIIVKKSNRVPRECINTLENIAKTYNGDVTLDNVKKALGGDKVESCIRFFEASNQSLEDVLEFIKALREADIRIDEFVSTMMAFIMDSMFIKHGIALDEYTPEYIKQIKQLFDMYDTNDFDTLTQIMEKLNTELSSDNTQNEVMLVIASMRISKIKYLTAGLCGEAHMAEQENRQSIYEHSKKVNESKNQVVEQLKIDIGIDNLKEEFGDIKQIDNTADILKQAIEKVEPLKEDNKDEEDTGGEESPVDNFFN